MSSSPIDSSESAPSPTAERESSAERPGTVHTPSPQSKPDEGDQTYFLSPSRVILAFIGLASAILCAVMDQSIVSTALPSIASDLHGGRESPWVVSAYLLASLAFAPTYGRLSDILGRKMVLLPALGIFWMFSLACALSQTMLQLIIFRAFKGIGGGALGIMVFIMASDFVPLRQRGTYGSILEIVSVIGTAIGPTLGGIFSQYASWRWCFWINLPLAGVSVLLILVLVPARPVSGGIKQKLLRIDYVGCIITILSTTLLLLALNWGGITYPWSSVAVLVPLIVGLAFMLAFLIWEGRVAALPIVPVYIFKNRTASALFLTNTMSGLVYFLVNPNFTFWSINTYEVKDLYYIPQFLQVVKGLSAAKSGLIMLALVVVTSVFMLIHGLIVRKTGVYRPSFISGYAIWTVAQGLLSTLDKRSGIAKITGFLVMTGVGAGGTIQTTLTAVQASVSRKDMAVATGVRTFLRLFGSTFAVAIAPTIINNSLKSVLEGLAFTPQEVQGILDDPTSIRSASGSSDMEKELIIDAYTKGFKNMFYLSVGCIFVSFAASTAFTRKHNLDRDDDEEMKDRARREGKSERKTGAASNA